ncbi:MAG: alkaline phosphatase, partial [Chitinophagaceae bacterium]
KLAVSRAHALKKPIRFWAAPDSPNAWYTLMGLDVDYINTDKIFEITSFLSRLPAVSFTSVNHQTIYRPAFQYDRKVQPVTSVILLIGDGMGLAQLYSAYTANQGSLNIFNMRSVGLSQTSATDTYITDSGGGGTAMATGKKTANRHIGVDSAGQPLLQLTAVAKKRGRRTGIITTGDIADATPASFYAHHAERDSLMLISGDFPTSSVDLLIGSGNYFNDEKGRKVLQQNGISRYNSVDEMSPASNRILVLDDKATLTMIGGRGDFLSAALSKSMSYLSSGKKGFFLMAEGAKIDLGGHQNNMATTVTELLDFDAAVGQAMQWADQHPGTLVVVTGDHETGGMSLINGDLNKGYVSGHFSTDDHTGIPVPVFAYGPQSDRFAGVYQNTEIFHRILALLQ